MSKKTTNKVRMQCPNCEMVYEFDVSLDTDVTKINEVCYECGCKLQLESEVEDG